MATVIPLSAVLELALLAMFGILAVIVWAARNPWWVRALAGFLAGLWAGIYLTDGLLAVIRYDPDLGVFTFGAGFAVLIGGFGLFVDSLPSAKEELIGD